MLSAPIRSPLLGQLVRSSASLTLCVIVCPQLTVTGRLACAGAAESAKAANTLSVRSKCLHLTVLVALFIAAPFWIWWHRPYVAARSGTSRQALVVVRGSPERRARGRGDSPDV